MTNNSFLPGDYKVPTESRFFSLKEPGTYKVRILSPVTIGFSYWREESGKNEKLRFRKMEDIPSDVASDKIDHFWFVKVYNHDKGKVQVWEITQKGIMKQIHGLYKDSDWGDPMTYDIKIVKEGVGKKTSYTVTPGQKTQLSDEVTAAVTSTKVVLDNIFNGGDLFPRSESSVSGGNTESQVPSEPEEE